MGLKPRRPTRYPFTPDELKSVPIWAVGIKLVADLSRTSAKDSDAERTLRRLHLPDDREMEDLLSPHRLL